MNHTAVYPGSFDPITNGHLDIIARAGHIFSRVVVAVSNRSGKKFTFSLAERLAMARKVTRHMPFVTVISFRGLLVDLAIQQKCFTIVRGLRAISDFEYEFQLALMNRSLNQKVETIFLMPDEKYTYLSSSLIKEIAGLGGDIGDFVPESIARIIRGKLT